MSNGKSKTTTGRVHQGTACTDKGIALVTALIISLLVFMLITSTLYVITSSTGMSGAGKRYSTAAEAADGSVEVMKEAINLILSGEPVSSLPFTEKEGKLVDAVLVGGPANVANVEITLPGSGLSSRYAATVTVERLYAKTLSGGRIEFARPGSNAGTTAVYFRISVRVEGKGAGTRAETTALYRFVG